MSGALDNLAENAYRRVIAHAERCPRCKRQGDGGDRTMMCAIGYRLLQFWEHAEFSAVRVG